MIQRLCVGHFQQQAVTLQTVSILPVCLSNIVSPVDGCV